MTSFENHLEIAANILILLFMVDPLYASNCQSLPNDWPWQCGIFAVFLTWIKNFISMKRFPLIGIYILMYVDILYTFLKIVAMTLPLNGVWNGVLHGTPPGGEGLLCVQQVYPQNTHNDHSGVRVR